MIVFLNANEDNKPITLHIGGLFDHENPLMNHGQKDLYAAQMAIKEINSRSDELFNNRYVFELASNNSKCDPVYAVDAFFHAIFRGRQLLFLIGTSCSSETKAVVQVADYYNLILFSHSTSFISQANQTYSTLVRLSVWDENYNDARVAFIQANNWSRVAIIHQDSIEHSLMMAKLAKRLNESNIEVILTQSASTANLTSALVTLQEKKARIVFVNFDVSARTIFFCEVYRSFTKQLRERYVWILTGNDYHLWNFSINGCSQKEIIDAARSHIIVDSSYEAKPSSINPKMTPEQLAEHVQLNTHLDRQTLHAYDAVWVIALLIRMSIGRNISIESFTYERTDMRDQWLGLLEEIYFIGVSGPVSFRNRRRRAETLISQFQTDSIGQYIEKIAEYSLATGLNTNCSMCRPLIWPGSTPVDRQRTEIHRLIMSGVEIALITTSCILGLALAIFFLTFNIIKRHQRYIKLSSPKLNNMMILGAMHIHISILLYALDEWFLARHLLGHACILRVFLFSGGFSLLFGSMFLKTLRVHRIFTSRDRPILQSKLLRDHHLLLVCLYLYIVDLIFAVFWQTFDPNSAQFTYKTAKGVNMDIIVLNEIYYCDSRYRHKIISVIYLYKSLFLVLGGYLAAKTRHVHIAALNDSKYIVWSIYIVVLTSLFSVIVMISMKTLRTYVVICLVVVLMTSSILCLIFLPKIIKLKNPGRGSHDIVSKDLVVDVSRTRRLIVKTSYFESYRYAQLQNRELKAELVRLNNILHALEQKLEPLASTVALALFPLAVRLAATFSCKPKMPSSPRSTEHEININPVVSSPEHEALLPNDSFESNADVFNCNQLLASSPSSASELNLSFITQTIDETSSLLLSALDNQQYATTDDETNTSQSLTPTQIFSDNESVLYSRLSDELNIYQATLDSDLERIDR
ncbi:unnamed protein product [Adineta ricciae]|uniref:G-protein coupled receptors family 3 profile domain-containing protein n=1 Tax=Adineta ricciae TaxID=249248 RepID=A0A813XDA1_ADIRI|nr:unnamed protein product [Adineta ricciae]CAF1051264.1 unnamed protein product [Adineta ricciae]